MNILISWITSIEGTSSGGSKRVQNWEEISLILLMLKEGDGTVDLDLIDAPDPGPASIQVAAENRNYLVTLFETTEDDTNVRSYTNTCATAEMVDILGDFWDARYLTQDFDLILRLFKEFFEVGDVSRQWLN